MLNLSKNISNVNVDTNVSIRTDSQGCQDNFRKIDRNVLKRQNQKS